MRNLIFSLTLLLFMALVGRSAAELKTPDFTLEDIDGELFRLSDHLGQGPLLIDFWATWCTPCKQELVYLQKLYENYKDDGFNLITISTDSPKSQSKVKPYVRSKRYTFPVLFDPTGEVIRLFQGNALPYQILLDGEGKIVETHQGYNPGDEVILEQKIQKLLDSESAGE